MWTLELSLDLTGLFIIPWQALCVNYAGTWTLWESSAIPNTSRRSFAKTTFLRKSGASNGPTPRHAGELYGLYQVSLVVHMQFNYKANPKAQCSFIVHTWALKGLPYHNSGVYVYTVKLHGAFGEHV